MPDFNFRALERAQVAATQFRLGLQIEWPGGCTPTPISERTPVTSVQTPVTPVETACRYKRHNEWRVIFR